MPLLLPVIVFIPLFFIIPLFALNERHSFKIAIVSSVLVFLLSISASYLGASGGGFDSLSFSQPYIQSLGINLSLQVTKYSNILLVMSAIVLLSASLVANSFIKESQRIYNFLFLLTESSTLGLFLSGNLFLFCVFWELSEVAMFFMIYVFGGFDRRYAAIKFIVYSVIAFMLLLVGVLVIYANVPAPTFEISSVISQSASIPIGAQLLAMFLLLFAFLIKIPVFPFHNWLPDAHTEAPTTGSMVLAGVMLKFGGYGFLLMLLMLPVSHGYSIYFAALFGFSALYSALIAIRQTHLKKLVAYTSIVNMSIASFGLASLNVLGTAGALYLMLSNGIVISLLFLLAGAIDESFGTMIIERIVGVARDLPSLAYTFIFSTFALVGIPLTSGFIGNLLVFSGAFKEYGTIGVIPIAAIALVGSFMFFVIEKSFMSVSKAKEPFSSPEKRVSYTIVFLIASTLVFGLFPALLMSPFAV